MTRAETQKSTDLEESISKAIKRVNARKETDLCQYIPGSKGRLHHLAFAKLKKKRPTELLKLLKEHILEKDAPSQVTSKPRAGLMVKRTIDFKLRRSQVNQLLNVLKSSGSEMQVVSDLLLMLAPHQTLKQVQKLMLDMVREKDIDAALWDTYVKLVQEERSVTPSRP